MRKGKVRRQDIPVSESIYGGMTRTELSQAQEKELQLTQQDIKMEQTKEKKNYLESYVYETRSKVMLEVLTLTLSFSIVFEKSSPGLCIYLQKPY